jgi:hypothetical protein
MPTDIINQNLRSVIQVCYEMLEIADRGDSYRKDSGCGAVYGRLRDAAYKIRLQAERELVNHDTYNAGRVGIVHEKSEKASINPIILEKTYKQKGKRDE